MKTLLARGYKHHVSCKFLHFVLSAICLGISFETIGATVLADESGRSQRLRSGSFHFASRAVGECSRECCDQLFESSSCDDESTDNPFTQTPLVFQIILIVLLIFMSAFFSGLTLGLMGLDRTGLEIVMEGDDRKFCCRFSQDFLQFVPQLVFFSQPSSPPTQKEFIPFENVGISCCVHFFWGMSV